MEPTISRLQSLLPKLEQYFMNTDEKILELKPNIEKWSKKEILGHLIDSAINNLVRFTEIQYSPKPYIYRSYNQNELVRINGYQSIDSNEILQFWLSINKQILKILMSQTSESLALKILLNDGSVTDLRYIMVDYADHMEHHINQIIQ